MSRERRDFIWEPWVLDPRVRFARVDGGIEVKIQSDGGFYQSEWCELGENVDGTVRTIATELGWKDPS